MNNILSNLNRSLSINEQTNTGGVKLISTPV